MRTRVAEHPRRRYRPAHGSLDRTARSVRLAATHSAPFLHCREGPPSVASYGAPAVAPAALTPSLFTIRGAAAGTPPANNAPKDRFTNSGAPRM